MTERARIVRAAVDRAAPLVHPVLDEGVAEASSWVAVPGLVQGHPDVFRRPIAPDPAGGEAAQPHRLDALRRWADPGRRQMGVPGMSAVAVACPGPVRGWPGLRSTAGEGQEPPRVPQVGHPMRGRIPARTALSGSPDPDGVPAGGGAPQRGRMAVAARPGLARSMAAGRDDLGGLPVPGDVLALLRRTRGRGEALPAELGAVMGAELDVDLTGVRIHTGSDSDSAARSLHAVAFADGADLHFRDGAYAPSTEAGSRLLAHEVTHVTQSQPPADAPLIGRADDPAEQAADHWAGRIVQTLRRSGGGNNSGRAVPGPACEPPSPLRWRRQPPAGDARPSPVPAALRRSREPTIRRLLANQVHQGRRYRYRLRGLREGLLTGKAGGWYKFDNNNDLKLHGAGDILEEVAAPPAQSFADILLARAGVLGFTDDTVLSAAIQTIFTGGVLAEDQLLQLYLQTPAAVASCLETAAALTDLFTAGGAPVAHGAATRNDGHSVTATGGLLATAVGAGRAAGCLVRIRYGTHGFIVVVRADNAEVFQSFAGMLVPETLVFNLRSPRQVHTNNLLLILQEMAVADATLRAEAQIVICGDMNPGLNAVCVLEDAEDAWPDLDFDWDVYALPDQATVLNRVSTRMQANFQNLNSRPGVGIPP